MSTEIRGALPVLDTPEQIHALADEIRHSGIIAIDTELDSYFSYFESICLLQISTPLGDHIADPLACDVHPLAQAVREANPIVIFHAGENDIPHLRKDFGFTFTRLFDTYIAAGILGYEHKSLAALILRHFGKVLDKRFQRADWRIRPLTDEMNIYARLDTHYLIELREKMIEELKAAGRLEDAETASQSIAYATLREKKFDPEQWTRVKGSRDLPKEKFAVLRELYCWRDHEARRINLQPFRVMQDSALTALAQASPVTSQDLLDLYPEMHPKRAEAIANAVRQGLAQGIIEIPKPSMHHKMSFAEMQKYYRLKKWRNKVSAEKKLPPESIVSNRIMKKLIMAPPSNLDELYSFEEFPKNSTAAYGEQIIEILNGK